MRARVLCFLALIAFLGGTSQARAAEDLSHWVDPFIGTGGHGHTFPGATLPFGMVQLSPDTRLEGWDGCSGYHYSDSVVYGFSHTHLSGTGVADYCDILFMPTVGEPRLFNGYPDRPDEGYASRFDKASEHAEPGWYAVRLEDYGIEVELTATERTGLHRYVFPEGQAGQVILDLEHRDQVLDSWIRVVSDTEIEGLRRSSSWAKDQWVYFVARFSKPFEHTIPAVGGVHSIQGEKLKAAFSFGSQGGELLMKVGISAVDVDGARANLDAEQPDWDFGALRDAARTKWNEALNKIVVEGGSEEQRTIFYTALYHTMIAPNLFSDVDGRYRGMDQKVHGAEGQGHYTVFSLWDTFRAAHPLYTLIEVERTNEFVQTMLAQYEQSSRLPVWELAANETNCMIGYHSVSVIADAYLKGIRGYDEDFAAQALLSEFRAREAKRSDRGAYAEFGYLPADVASESVSKTLEYAYDDWCIARFLQASGKDDSTVVPLALQRSQAWRNLYDPDTSFLRARENGGWLTPFDPRRVDFHHTEANAWQYRFFVPHDVESMMEELGGEEAFVARLDSLFTADSQTTGRTQSDITGLIGQYAHGNEPSHHVAWLYHYAGRPEKGMHYVHRILEELYRAAPDGLSGNEDCGQMSAWYVLSALGLYQVAPGSNQWLLGAPLFPRASLHLGAGRELVIEAKGAAKGQAIVVSVERDGTSHPRSWISHEELVSTERIAIELASQAGNWGYGVDARPSSRVEGDAIVPAPWIDADRQTFRGELEVSFHCAEEGVRFVRLTQPFVEDAEPFSQDLLHEVESGLPDRLTLSESTELRVVAIREHGARSQESRAYFHRIPHDWTVEVESVPNPQYTAGGNDALIDGLLGPDDWRTGRWLGYQDQDFVAVVDLQEALELQRIGASFLQDMRSWIWMPSELRISTSLDGNDYLELGRVGYGVLDDLEGVFRQGLSLDAGGILARYVKVHAVNYGKIPAWHPGAGGEAFIFVDEILVETP